MKRSENPFDFSEFAFFRKKPKAKQIEPVQKPQIVRCESESESLVIKSQELQSLLMADTQSKAGTSTNSSVKKNQQGAKEICKPTTEILEHQKVVNEICQPAMEMPINEQVAGKI